MLPDQVLNPGPQTYESGALPIALRGPAFSQKEDSVRCLDQPVIDRLQEFLFKFEIQLKSLKSRYSRSERFSDFLIVFQT